MADFEVLLDRNDMLARVTIKNKSSGAAITSASSATVALYDSHSKEVVGTSWPKDLSHQSGGTWEASIPYGISERESGGSVKPGDELLMEVTINAGVGLFFYQRKQVRVKERN